MGGLAAGSRAWAIAVKSAAEAARAGRRCSAAALPASAIVVRAAAIPSE